MPHKYRLLGLVLVVLLLFTILFSNKGSVEGIRTTNIKLDAVKITEYYKMYRIDRLVDRTYEEMTIEERVGQLFM